MAESLENKAHTSNEPRDDGKRSDKNDGASFAVKRRHSGDDKNDRNEKRNGSHVLSYARGINL